MGLTTPTQRPRHVHSSSSLELVAAFAACISFGVAAWWLRLLGSKASVCLDHSVMLPVHHYRSWKKVLLWMVWIAIVLVLSVPTALYILSNSLPPDDNVLSLGPTLLIFFEKGAAPILYTISAWLVPRLARLVVKRITGEPNTKTAAQMMMLARLSTTLLIPFALILILDQQCFGLWLQLWSPCSDVGTFDITIKTFIEVITVTRHNDICWPGYNSECPRYDQPSQTCLVCLICFVVVSKAAGAFFDCVPLSVGDSTINLGTVGEGPLV